MLEIISNFAINSEIYDRKLGDGKFYKNEIKYEKIRK